MKIIFVHGWSVHNTSTYGELPKALLKWCNIEDVEIDIHHIYLGRYISFHDEVKVDDIARAFNHAITEEFGDNLSNIPFSCITHSTGAPVIRTWIDLYYGADNLADLPLQHLMMLAPANHGSALAQLGKAKVGRIKAWMDDVEPGQGVLDWLELGSDGQRQLNRQWMKYECPENGFYPFVLTGQAVNKKLYDYLNSYTGEAGSDGVVRVCGANMNYRHIALEQDINHDSNHIVNNDDSELEVYPLKLNGNTVASPRCGLEIIPNASHTGKKMGIMESVKLKSSRGKRVIHSIIDCLKVNSIDSYTAHCNVMTQRTQEQQKNGHQYAMVVFRVADDRGNIIKDYDIYLLATGEYKPEKLPEGFFVDRQKNHLNGAHLTYYLNCTKMHKIADGKFGFRIVARPDKGFSHYSAAEFHSGGISIKDLLIPNQTLMVDIELKRRVDEMTFSMDDLTVDHGSFKDEEASDSYVP